MSATDQMELEEQFFPTTAAQWQRRLPWIRLLRGFRMAIGPRRMLLAFLALCLWSAGDWLINAGETDPAGRVIPTSTISFKDDLPSERKGIARMFPTRGERPFTEIRIVEVPPYWLNFDLISPLTRVLAPAKTLILSSQRFSSYLPLLLTFLLGAVISAVFGGAIARMTAVDFATQTDLSLRSSLLFSIRHWAASLGAPLIALVGFAGCWLFNFCGGLLANLPVLGEILVAVCWGLLILSGFAMAFILLVIGLGWPLMIAAVNAESGDAFDALSRACSYLLNRPWYALFLAGLALLYGTVLLMFVTGMTQFTASMTTIPYAAGLLEGTGTSQTAASVRLFWERLLFAVPASFVFSYFWTMVTLIYFLLRQREDATPLNEVWLPEPAAESKMPLAGIPAAEQREIRLRQTPPDTDAPAEAP